MGKRLAAVWPALVLLLAPAAAAAAAEPARPGPKERCAVCGMFVAPHSDWVATIVFRDGTQAFFDGPKDMFICFFDLPGCRPGGAEVSALFVTEYYTTQLVDVREVFFVTGSDVLGPMGKELVPVRGRENAETFRRDHGGDKIMRFDGSRLVEAIAEP